MQRNIRPTQTKSLSIQRRMATALWLRSKTSVKAFRKTCRKRSSDDFSGLVKHPETGCQALALDCTLPHKSSDSKTERSGLKVSREKVQNFLSRFRQLNF